MAAVVKVPAGVGPAAASELAVVTAVALVLQDNCVPHQPSQSAPGLSSSFNTAVYARMNSE